MEGVKQCHYILIHFQEMYLVSGHSIHMSILFWLVKIQKEVGLDWIGFTSGHRVRVNLINQFRWDLLCSFSLGATEVDVFFTAPLPPSNKTMNNCWP